MIDATWFGVSSSVNVAVLVVVRPVMEVVTLRLIVSVPLAPAATEPRFRTTLPVPLTAGVVRVPTAGRRLAEAKVMPAGIGSVMMTFGIAIDDGLLYAIVYWIVSPVVLTESLFEVLVSEMRTGVRQTVP